MMEVARLRVAADYDCHAIWRRRPDGGLDNLAPADLELSARLERAFNRWAEVYTSTLDMEDPMASGFATPLEHELFVEWGRTLASELARELAEPVEYFDDLTQEPVSVDVGE